MFQKLANSDGVGLQIEKILHDFIWNDPKRKFIDFSFRALSTRSQVHIVQCCLLLRGFQLFFTFTLLLLRTEHNCQKPITRSL